MDGELIRYFRAKYVEHNRVIYNIFMALTAPSLEGLLLGQFAANGILGSYTPQLAKAISLGISTYFLSANKVVTVDGGVMAGGYGFSTVVGINSGVLTPMLIGTMAQNGILGTFQVPLATAISVAFATWFVSNQTITTHPTVGTGFGVGEVIGLEPSGMEAALIGFMSQFGILGVYQPKLCNAIANAVVPHILSAGKVFTPITGNGSIIPSGGAGFGFVV